MGYLLTPQDDLQEAFISNSDLSWFADVSYFKDDNGKYCAVYVITTPFYVILVAMSWIIISCTSLCFSQGQSYHISTDSRYIVGAANDFEMFCEQCGFLTYSGNEIKKGLCWAILGHNTFTCYLAITKISEHLEAMEFCLENHQ